MAKAGNARGGFGAGSRAMGGPGKKPVPPKTPPKMGAMKPTMGAAPPPSPSDNDGDEMGGYRKGGVVKGSVKKGGKRR